MEITVWLNDQSKIFIGGDPEKGQKPLITVGAKAPQILISEEKNKIVIVETTTK
jgi:hypothetical protein